MTHSGTQQETSEAGTDDRDVTLVDQRRSNEAWFDVRVVDIAREVSGDFDVLIISIVADPTISFSGVTIAQRIGIKRQSADQLLKIGTDHGRVLSWSSAFEAWAVSGFGVLGFEGVA